MRRIRLIILAIIVVLAVTAIIFFLLGFLKPKVAGIFIETDPPATVFINGEQVGRSPYKDTRDAGEITVKLIPESFDKPLAPYETRISLVSGVETVVRRDFGEFDNTSSGEIISFEKIARDQTGLVVVSIPNSVQLLIDGQQRSITPHKATSIFPGEHNLLLTSDGYFDRSVEVKTHNGYKLTAIVQLALSDEEKEEMIVEEKETIEEEEVIIQVKILLTPVGFLRVRDEPSTLGKEVGRVEPGEVFDLLATDEKTGWFKIEHEKDEEGWVSNQYSEKLQESEGSLPVATPSAALDF